MARAGDAVEHPLTGDRMVFSKTARDTDGELLRLDFFLKGGGPEAAAHVHSYQEERFEVLSGAARFRVRGQEGRDVGAGETIVVPAGTPHTLWNADEEEARLILEFRPALRTETLFENLFGLAQDGKVDPGSGLPGPLQMALILREFEDEIYLAGLPLLVQRALFGLLATVGGLLGYKARYPRYSGPEEEQPPGRGGGRPSAASGPTTGGIAVASVVAVLALLMLRRRSPSSRRR